MTNRMAIAAAVARNLSNKLPADAAEFCRKNGLGVEHELAVACFAADMVRYGINVARAAHAAAGGDGGAQSEPVNA